MKDLLIALAVLAGLSLFGYTVGQLQKTKAGFGLVASHFFRQWNEFIFLPIMLLLWKGSEVFLRWLDPLSAPFDSGVLQKFIYAIIGTLAARFVATLLMRINYPKVHAYLYSYFEQDLIIDQATEPIKPNPDLVAKFGPNRAKQLTPKEFTINNLQENRCRRLNYSLLLFALDLLVFAAVLHTV